MAQDQDNPGSAARTVRSGAQDFARLHTELSKLETELTDEVVRDVKHSSAHHYVDMDLQVLHRRIEVLVARLLQSIRETPKAFIAHVVDIAEARVAEGFALGEILLALRVLEEKAWAKTVAVMPIEEQVISLSRISGTIGAAKDRLAEIYVRAVHRGLTDEPMGTPV